MESDAIFAAPVPALLTPIGKGNIQKFPINIGHWENLNSNRGHHTGESDDTTPHGLLGIEASLGLPEGEHQELMYGVIDVAGVRVPVITVRPTDRSLAQPSFGISFSEFGASATESVGITGSLSGRNLTSGTPIEAAAPNDSQIADTIEAAWTEYWGQYDGEEEGEVASAFVDRVQEVVLHHGNSAVKAIAERILKSDPAGNRDWEGLKALAQMDDPQTAEERKWLMREALSASDPGIRYAAAGVARAVLGSEGAKLLRARRREEKNASVRAMIDAYLR